MSYWEEVRERWNDFQAVIDDSSNYSAVRMKKINRFSLRRLTVPIAVTGLRGAGKTVLYDALLGKIQHGYVPWGKSFDAEKHRVAVKTRSRKFRSAIVVVPGQESQERNYALDKMFAHGRHPVGVIHVVCWGYNKIWSPGDHDAIKRQLESKNEQTDLSAVREWNKREELKDFENTCTLLRQAWERRKHVWLVIAVAKCDLFWSDIAAARDYYIPGSASSESAESEFCELLRDLVGYVGMSNFDRLAVVPISCYPEDYSFDSKVGKQTSFGFPRTSNLVEQFRALIGDFCASRFQ